jgi:hypothetical protein
MKSLLFSLLATPSFAGITVIHEDAPVGNANAPAGYILHAQVTD